GVRLRHASLLRDRRDARRAFARPGRHRRALGVRRLDRPRPTRLRRPVRDGDRTHRARRGGAGRRARLRAPLGRSGARLRRRVPPLARRARTPAAVLMESFEAFPIRCVVHLVRPTGTRVTTLDELRQAILEASDASLFNHCVQYQLRNPASKELPPDDFSAWVGGVVQDRATAERMSFAVSSHNRRPGELRRAWLRVLDDVPASQRTTRTADAEGAFVFLEVEPVALPTGVHVMDDSEAVEALANADVSAWFYQVVEQPWFAADRPTLH